MVEERFRGVLLQNVAAVHEQHPAPDLPGEAHLVGDHHHGHTLLGQLLHHVQHLAHHLGVQSGGGLVKEHHLGLHSQGPDDGDALLLSAGQLVGVGVRLVEQVHPLEEGGGHLVGLGLAHQLSLHRGQGDVFTDGHVGEEVEVLEHHAHLLADLVNLHFGVGDDRVFKGDGACGGGFQQVETAQEGGLARPGGADDHHFFSGADVLGDAVQHQVVPEGLGQVFNVDHFGAASFPACPGAR